MILGTSLQSKIREIVEEQLEDFDSLHPDQLISYKESKASTGNIMSTADSQSKYKVPASTTNNNFIFAKRRFKDLVEEDGIDAWQMPSIVKQ